jgi:hypothetical protein
LSRGSRLDGQDPPALFLRGDPNRDGRVTLSDVFSILRYLSLGASLQCKDAADVDDNGVINQTDALFLLGTIFYRQYPLPPPFFRAGADPTPDLLGCRQGLAQRGAAGGDDMDGGQAQDADEAGCSEGENGGTADLEFIHFHGTVLASPGDERIRAPVFLKSEKGLEGFTLSFQAPLEWIRLERIDFLGTVVGDLNPPPDWIHLFTGQQEAGYLAASVALSIGSSLRTFPAFHDDMVAILEFSVSEAAPLGVTIPIQFRSTPGRDGLPAILNEISRKGNPQPYNACGLKVEVVPGGDLFIRGDANRDRVVNLVDVISILRWLFVPRNEGTWVPCPDAADVDDNGQIEVTDAIEVVLYLFGRGSAPSPPFPAAGRDPEWTSPDSLGCLEEAVSG